MKLIKLRKEQPVLFQFLSAHAPCGFYVKRKVAGYSYYYQLRLKTCQQSWYTPATVVAEIFDNRIVVNQPQYLSDVQDMVRKFEEMGGGEVTIEYQDDH
jgi:hypothetical protein